MWNVANLRDFWGVIDAGFLIGLLFLVGRYAKEGAWTDRRYRSIALVVLAVIMGFAAVTSNYGAAFRHRAKFTPAVVVLFAYGYGHRARRIAVGSHVTINERPERGIES